MMSGRSFASPYNPHVAPTSFASQPPRLTPLTSGASGLTLSQSARGEERLESRCTRLISRNRTPLAQYLTPNPYTTLEDQGGEVPSLEDKIGSLRR